MGVDQEKWKMRGELQVYKEKTVAYWNALHAVAKEAERFKETAQTPGAVSFADRMILLADVSSPEETK